MQDKHERISCGIVLYNPDIKRLTENVNAIISQVETVYFIDNSDNDVFDEKVWERNQKIKYISNHSNKGIAYALNQLILQANQDGYEWILTLDQDSVCPENMIDSFCEYLNDPLIAMVAPLIQDRNLEKSHCHQKQESEIISKCITSGTLTRIKPIIDVGGFDNYLFIDYVDYDICAKLRRAGYKIIRDNKSVLLHQYGNIKEIRFCNLRIRITNHNATRRYYKVRNRIFCSRRYPEQIPMWRTVGAIIIEAMKVFLFEDSKASKLNAIWNGVYDGLLIRLQY